MRWQEPSLCTPGLRPAPLLALPGLSGGLLRGRCLQLNSARHARTPACPRARAHTHTHTQLPWLQLHLIGSATHDCLLSLPSPSHHPAAKFQWLKCAMESWTDTGTGNHHGMGIEWRLGTG